MPNDETHFRFKETELMSKHKGKRDEIPIHQVQYTLDNEEREERFIRNQHPTQESYERYKWYREEWHRRPKECDPGDFPLAVCCELVSTCNLACSMCYTITDDFENAITGAQRMMPWPFVKNIIDEAVELGVPSMLFSWRGEPTLYRWKDEDGSVITFPDVLAYARKMGILEITAITHGQFMQGEFAERVIDAEPSWISFSIDGMGEHYNKIRTPPNKAGTDYDAFSVVIDNIKNFVRIRNEKGKTRPQVRTNAIFPAISPDPEAYRKTLIEAGVDMITVNEILDLRAGDLPDDARNDVWGCQYPFQRLSVTANGIMLPCTGAYLEQSGLVLGRYKGNKPKVVRNRDGSMAAVDVPEMTIKSAWHSDKLNKIREQHATGRRQEIAPGCRDCNHGAKKHGVDRLPVSWDLNSMSWKNVERLG